MNQGTNSDAEIDARLRALAARLKIRRPLCFLDLESTGTSPEADRAVEIAYVAIHPDGRIRRFRSFINPGIPIPPDATAVHGISDDQVKDAPSFKSLAADLHRYLSRWDIGGFNVRRYDLRMLSAEFARAGLKFSAEDATVIDAMSIFHRNERRDLTAAVKFYCERDHDGHRAEEDVAATIDVMLRQLDRYADVPGDVAKLDAYCRGRREDWLTIDGRIVWRDNAARIDFGKYKGKTLQDLAKEDPGYLRWMVDKDFSDETRKLAEDAIQGRFPFPVPAKADAPAPEFPPSGAFPIATRKTPSDGA